MKRVALLLLLFVSFSFCAECEGYNGSDCVLWKDPPLGTMLGNNIGSASGLMGNGALMSGVEITKSNLAVVDVRVLTALPMVDDKMPSNATGILWTWGEKSANDTIIHTESGGNCTHDYIFTVPEYGIWDYNWTAWAYFTFRNETRSVELLGEAFLGGSGVEPQAIIEIPPSIAGELETANGTENLSVRIEWEFYYYFKYLNDPGGSCEATSHVEMEEITVTGSHEMQFIVESGEPEFFNVRPALGEQWYLSNHFDNFVFSRKGIYKAGIWKDGEWAGDARISNFTLVHSSEPGLTGVWYIFSHPARDFENASMGGHEISYWATPLVEGNISFSHLYEINHTYEEWGPHTMEVRVWDIFGGEYSYSREIVSRKATLGGISETGEPAGDILYYRPGIGEEERGELSRFVLPSSTLLVVFLVFSLWAYAYYRRKREKGRR